MLILQHTGNALTVCLASGQASQSLPLCTYNIDAARLTASEQDAEHEVIERMTDTSLCCPVLPKFRSAQIGSLVALYDGKPAFPRAIADIIDLTILVHA